MSLTMALPAAQVTPSSSAPASSGQSQGTGGAGNASAANGAASSASSNSNNTSNPAPASDTTGSAQAANAAAAGQAGSTGAAAPEPGMFAQMLGLQMANLGASATTGSANGAAGTSGAGAKSTGKTLNQAGALLDPAQLTSALLAALQQSTGTQTADASKGGQTSDSAVGGVSGAAAAAPSLGAAAANAMASQLDADDDVLAGTTGKRGAGLQNLPQAGAVQPTLLPQASGQQAPASTTTVAAGTVGATATTFNNDQLMGSSAWSKAISDQVMTMVSMKAETATIQVSPPQLGPIEVSLKMDGQNNASVTFTADNAATRAALEQSLPRLHSMMAASGIQLGDTHVSSGQSQQQQQQQSSRSFRTVLPDEVGDDSEVDTLASIKAARGVLSIFA